LKHNFVKTVEVKTPRVVFRPVILSANQAYREIRSNGGDSQQLELLSKESKSFVDFQRVNIVQVQPLDFMPAKGHKFISCVKCGIECTCGKKHNKDCACQDCEDEDCRSNEDWRAWWQKGNADLISLR
jgi:hypothetical protein